MCEQDAVTSLSLKAFKIALRVFNTGSMLAHGEFFKAKQVLTLLKQHRLLAPVNSRPESLFVNDVEHDLVMLPNGEGVGYFSSDRGWVPVHPEDIQRYRIQVQSLLKHIKTWLGMSLPHAFVELVPSLVWDLGDLYIKKRKCAMLFIRRAQFPKTHWYLKEALMRFPRKRHSIILTDTNLSPYGCPLPGDPKVMPFLSLISPSQEDIKHIDPSYLATLLEGAPFHSVAKEPVWCSEEGAELRIYDKTFRFKGVIQQGIIRQLFLAWQEGLPHMSTAAVLENAHSKAPGLSQAFSRCKTDWRSVVGYEGGRCWLIV